MLAESARISPNNLRRGVGRPCIPILTSRPSRPAPHLPIQGQVPFSAGRPQKILPRTRTKDESCSTCTPAARIGMQCCPAACNAVTKFLPAAVEIIAETVYYHFRIGADPVERPSISPESQHILLVVATFCIMMRASAQDLIERSDMLRALPAKRQNVKAFKWAVPYPTAPRRGGCTATILHNHLVRFIQAWQ